MKKLTIEELETEGTKLGILPFRMKYSNPDKQKNQFIDSEFFNTKNFEFESLGYTLRHDEQCIKVTKVLTQNEYFMKDVYEIPLSEFRRIGILKEPELPSQYAVICTSIEQCNHVMELVYNKKNYTNKNHDCVLIHEKGFNGSHLYNIIIPSGYPEFLFHDWKKLFRKSKVLKVLSENKKIICGLDPAVENPEITCLIYGENNTYRQYNLQKFKEKNKFMEHKEEKIKELENKLSEIQKEINSLKQEKDFKDGDWIFVKSNSSLCNYIFKIKSNINNRIISYTGISYSDDINNCSFIKEDTLIFTTYDKNCKTFLATEYQIKATLIKIAIHKKFDKFNLLNRNLLYKYDFNSDELYLEGKTIYANGVWAEPEKPFEIIPGYPVEYIDNNVCKINNDRYYRKDIEELAILLKTMLQAKSINVGCSGQYKIEIKDLENY